VTDQRQAAIARIREWKANPCKFVYDNFGITELDRWQEKALMTLPDPKIQRLALSACVGPGKTFVLSISGLYFLSCYAGVGEHPKGVAVSTTYDNLSTNLWPEISKWLTRSKFLSAAFTWTKERVFAKDHPSTWFLSARSFNKSSSPDEQGRTLSGLHSKYVLCLIDESGDIPLPVLKAGEQALSNCTWGKIIQAGNPTSTGDSMLYQACTALRDKWHVIKITSDPDDPDRTPRVSAEWAREQIATFGKDNPWIMSSILGQFPPSGLNSLFSLEEVEAAMSRHLSEDQYSFSQKRIGIDVARFGLDRTVITPRWGLASFKPVEMRNARTEEIVARVMEAQHKWNAEMIMIDSTGGWGAGVADALLQAGVNVIEVNFAGKPTDPRFFNKRAELYWRLSEWIKRGGAIPKNPDLIKELTAIQFTYQNSKFRIEEKAQIKERIGVSTDYADSLVTTFCFPDMPTSAGELGLAHQFMEKSQHKVEYDPFDNSQR